VLPLHRLPAWKKRVSIETLERRILLTTSPLYVDDLFGDFRGPAPVAQQLQATILPLSSTGNPIVPEPGTNYLEFAEFAETNFGAEVEPLAYDAFGNDLVFLGPDYLHVSETSAFIGSETNLPADAVIEYREVGGSEAVVDPSSRYHYLHHHYLTDLASDTTYEYRVIAEDERGNVIESTWQTFSTATPNGGNVTYLSGGQITDAYEITTSGYYVLTGDLIADRTAFKITASDVTLDLDGHTVTYNEEDFQLTGGAGNDFSLNASYGVWTRWVNDISVYNGTIIQGAGENDAQENSIGYSPVHFRNIRSGEVAGITAYYAGDQVTGINVHDPNPLPGNDILIHHNTVEDRGNVVTNRHQGAHAIQASGTAHHNLVLRGRNRGLNMRRSDDAIPSEVYNNEIYIDSYAANSYGIMYYGFEGEIYDGEIWNNRIFGTGHMMFGIGILLDADGFDVHDNFIHTQSTTPTRESPGDTYGVLSRSGGLRTWGYDPCEGTTDPSCLLTADGLEFYDNHIAIHARSGGDGRALWLYSDTLEDSNYITNNDISFTLEDDILDLGGDSGAVVVTGGERTGQTDLPAYTFEDNSIRSNFVNVMLGHDYGAAFGTLFRNNLLEQTGSRADYDTVHIGYSHSDHYDHEFFDTSFAGGAGFSEVEWVNLGGGDNNFAVGKQRSLEFRLNGLLLADTTVTVQSIATGKTTQITTDSSGSVDHELLHYLAEEAGNSERRYRFTVPIGSAILTLEESDVISDATIPITFVSPPPPNISDTVAHWDFELDATDKASLGSQADDGTLVGGATFEPGGIDDSTLRLDGNGSSVEFASSPDINEAFSRKSISLWFFADDLQSSGRQVIYEQGDATSGMNIYLENGVLFAGAWNDDAGWDGTWLADSTSVDDEWNHVAMILNADNGTLDLLVNGVSAHLSSSSLVGDHDPANIGAVGVDTRFWTASGFENSTASSEFTGFVDDVRVYDRAISMLDAASLASISPATPPSTLPVPEVVSIEIEDRSQQRSMVRSITVTFDHAVALAADAFVLQNATSSSSVTPFVSLSVDNKVATLTFSGAEVIGGSLADGNYTLTVDKTKVSAIDGGMQLAADHTDDFFRLYGDMDGDRDIDSRDFRQFRNTYRKAVGDSDFNSALDFDGDGDVDSRDFRQFRTRYRTRLDP